MRGDNRTKLLPLCPNQVCQDVEQSTGPAAGRARGQGKPHGKCGDVLGSCASVSAGELGTARHACPAIKPHSLAWGTQQPMAVHACSLGRGLKWKG